MSKDLIVSVITASYNCANTIEQSILSVIEQTYNNIELIIVDGGSTDKTIDVLKKYSKQGILHYISESDNGVYDAMNKGIALSAGDIVFFLNSDDKFYDCNVISDVIREFKNRQETHLLYGNVVYNHPQDNTQKLKSFKYLNKNNIIFENLCHQSVFARRSLFDEVGLFDTKYKIVADFDWLLKIFFSKYYKVFYMDRTIALFNYGGMHVVWDSLHKTERMDVKLKYINNDIYLFKEFVYKLKRKLKKYLNYRLFIRRKK